MEARVVFLKQDVSHHSRSFWEKARDDNDRLLLVISIMVIVLLSVALLGFSFHYNDMAAVLTVEQSVIVVAGAFALIILLGLAIYGLIGLVGQISERD